jgi:hypothetical protein
MPCSSCNENNITILGYSQISSQNGNCGCTDCDPSNVANSSCVFYSGPNLSCLQVNSCDDLNTVLSKIDEKLCTVVGNYTLYNKYCVDDTLAITTEQQFVESISQQFCTLKTTVNTFTETTFVTYQNTVDTRFDAIEVPAIVCTSASVLNTDSLNTVLNKYCTQISNINTKLNIADVDWDQCFVVSSPPTNLLQAFDLIIDQICSVKTLATGSGAILPTFNNIGSCLAAPVTATDTLVDTVNKIKNKLCTLPTFDNTTVTWGCVTSAVTLQNAMQNVITKLSNVAQSSIVSVSSDFILTPLNVGDICQGWQLNFAGSITDRKFSLNSGDAVSGFFLDKVQAGSGINFDLVSVPGKVLIKTSADGEDVKVKSYLSDPSGGFLIDKVEGGIDITAGLTLNVSLNASTNKVKITPVLDLGTFISSQLSFIANSTALRSVFCSLVNNCITNPPVGPGGSIFYVVNNLSGAQISAIQNVSAYSITNGSLPISSNQSVTGVVLGTTTAMSVTVTGSPIVPGSLKLYKNGVLQQCINVTVANTFTFTAVTYTVTDTMTITMESGACNT